MRFSASSTVPVSHSAEFKTQVVLACEQAGASIAATALANGVNANRVHRWLREHRSGVVWAGGDLLQWNHSTPAAIADVSSA